MRLGSTTVGGVADGTGTLDRTPVTEQDAFATEHEQISTNPVERPGQTVAHEAKAGLSDGGDAGLDAEMGRCLEGRMPVAHCLAAA